MKILILDGPNVNLLGLREPDIYGTDTYEQLRAAVAEHCKKLKIAVSFYQTNHEGSIIDKIQESMKGIDGIVLNPGGYTHTSVAIADAILAASVPTVEVHISDFSKREHARRQSLLSDACIYTVKGKGIKGYIEAVDLLKKYIDEKEKQDV